MENTLISLIFNILYNFGYILIQFIEEICLLFCSREFYKLVKKQFFKNYQTAVVNTIFVEPYSQQPKNNKINNNGLIPVN